MTSFSGMQGAELNIRMQVVGRDTTDIHVDCFDTIDECLQDEGLVAEEGATVIVAYQGRRLDTRLSFHFNGVTNNAHLVVLVKSPKRQRPPFTVFGSARRAQIMAENREAIEKTRQIRRREMARLSDMAFASWEMVPQFANIAQAILSAQDKREREMFTFAAEEPTVVAKADGPNTAPLPTLIESKPLFLGGIQTTSVGISPVISDPARKEVAQKGE